jgi:hypothetical protein
MNELIFPGGDAQRLWDMRISGFKPTEMIMVSMIGELTTGRWQIYPNQEVHPKNQEWRWVRDLQICLVYDSTCNKDKVKAFALEIAKNKSVGDRESSMGFYRIFVFVEHQSQGWLTHDAHARDHRRPEPSAADPP